MTRVFSWFAIATLLATAMGCSLFSSDWTDEERALLATLWIGSLPDVADDPSNAYDDDARAIRFGKDLFFDARLSRSESVSCASCHHPERAFADDKPLSDGMGKTARHTPALLGVGHLPWLYWDGRRDSLWSQALAPIEHPDEMGLTRTEAMTVIAEHYRDDYEALFGPLPAIPTRPASPQGNEDQQSAWESLPEPTRKNVNRAFANIGKAIAAFEQTLLPRPSRFDMYVETLLADGREAARQHLNESEERGLFLFMRDGKCTMCHNGPLLTNTGFHNIGLPLDGRSFDRGRLGGVPEVRGDEFNCLSEYSDAPEGGCDELRFMKLSGFELVGAIKTPTLRNVAKSPPYMHTGQFATLADVVTHYDTAPVPLIGHSDLEPLGLSARDKADLEAFLRSLTDVSDDSDQSAMLRSGPQTR